LDVFFNARAMATKIAAGYDRRPANTLRKWRHINPVDDDNFAISNFTRQLQRGSEQPMALSYLLPTIAATPLEVGRGFVAIPWLGSWTVGIGLANVAVAILALAAIGNTWGCLPTRRAASVKPICALRYQQ
jgi:hypothetical protein